MANNFREQDILILSGVEEVVGTVGADVVSSGAVWLVGSDSGVDRADKGGDKKAENKTVLKK